jgi:Mce-associated membrane protein
VTAVLHDTDGSPTIDEESVRLASWQARAAALLIDFAPGTAVIATMALLAVTADRGSWVWWVFTGIAALAALATLANRTVAPTLTGWTLGRAVCGIRVVTRTGAAVSAPRLLLRDLAHLLDTAAVLLGWLWPLWDDRHRTFADLLARTEVRVVDPLEHDVRRRAGVVFVVAALVCAAGSGLAYQQIYRHDQAIDRARSQIAEQGPRIVEKMLSYGASTVKDDFANAQSLSTDAYRPQLIAQQEAVEKSGVVSNEYWAVSSAVLNNTATTASMLLALQGQRGDNATDLRFITATVRVDFVKVGDDRWSVENLTVLKRPAMNAATGGAG